MFRIWHLQIVLPEGSKEPSLEVPFAVNESQEVTVQWLTSNNNFVSKWKLIYSCLWQQVKYSYLDSFGRTVVVVSKKNIVQEHNVFFEVIFITVCHIFWLYISCIIPVQFFLFSIAIIFFYAVYDFSLLFHSCVVILQIQLDCYAGGATDARGRFSPLLCFMHCICAVWFFHIKVISFLSGSYTAWRGKSQNKVDAIGCLWKIDAHFCSIHVQVMDTIQKLQNILNLRRVNISEKLESSLRDLARTGDIQSCKAARKAADAALKESAKDLKALHDSLLSLARSLNVLPKVLT